MEMLVSYLASHFYIVDNFFQIVSLMKIQHYFSKSNYFLGIPMDIRIGILNSMKEIIVIFFLNRIGILVLN